MRQALHIFRKDVRHLWPQIVIALILAAAHAALDVLQTPVWRPGTERINELAGLSSFLLTLAWWALIAALIYEETLPGDCQFWVTRPYSWKSLLGAKVLFIVAFVNVPLLVSDCFVLGLQGFPVWTNLPDLLFRQLLVSCWLVLPSFALAALTSGMGQFVLAFLAVITGIITEEFLMHSGGSSSGLEVSTGAWGLPAVLLASVAVIFWQYSKRQTMGARLMLACVVFVIVPGLTAIPDSKGSTSETKDQKVDVSGVRVSYDLARMPSGIDTNRFGLGTGTLLLPLHVSGLPPETALVDPRDDVVIGADDKSFLAGTVQRKGDDYYQSVYLTPAKLQAVKSHRVSLRVKMHFTVVTDRVTKKAPAWQRPIAVPGLGFCEAYTDLQAEAPQVLCSVGVHRAAAALVWVEHSGFRSEPVQSGQVTSGYNVFGGLSPVEKWVIPLSNPGSSKIRAATQEPGAELSFTVQWPLADVTRELNLADVDLARFVVMH